MAYDQSVIAVFSDHRTVEAAMTKLTAGEITTGDLSIVGKGHQADERNIGFYHADGRIKFWGRRGAFWGGLWDLFPGGVSLTLPIVGHIMVLGYLASIVVSAVEGAILNGGLSALGAALYSTGIPKDSVRQYELAITAGGFLIVVHGTGTELARARTVLGFCNPTRLDFHGDAAVPPSPSGISSPAGNIDSSALVSG